MPWYKYALRKNYLKFDPRVHIDIDVNSQILESTLSSFLTAAIIKGLDIIGIVSNDIQIPIKAKLISDQSKLDLFVLCGQNYKTEDGFDIVIYGSANNIESNKTLIDLLLLCNERQLKTMVYNVGKLKSKKLINISKRHNVKPTFIEIFNSNNDGYLYVESNIFELVSSGVNTPSIFEKTRIYSLVQRKDMEKIQIIPEGYGINFIPSFLEVN